MRPLRLVMQAFGPYADREVVDFRELKDKSFLLIHGPTGAGKTSILDAICYAFFGETSSNERQAHQMRSDHSDPSTQTEIIFDFALGAEQYRIKRIPEQFKPKKGKIKQDEITNQEGDDKQQAQSKVRAQATLYKRSGINDDNDDGTILASQLNKVTEEVEKLLGFASEQFRQVVLLPQGKFRDLLLADSNKRQAILETLFQTELYRKIEEALKDKADQISKDAQSLEENKKTLLTSQSVDSLNALKERLESTTIELKSCNDRLLLVQNREKKESEEFNQALLIENRINEFEEAQKIFTTMQEELPAITLREKELSTAKKAVSLAPQLHKVIDLKDKIANLHLQLEELGNNKTESLLRLQELQKVLEHEKNREAERENARTQVSIFQEQIEKLENCKQLQLSTKQLSAQRKQKESLLNENQSHLESSQNELEKVNLEINSLGKEPTDTHNISLQIKNFQSLKEQISNLAVQDQQIRKLSPNLERSKQNLVDKKENLTTAKQRLDQLDALWVSGQSAVLAKTLSEGKPCPVCGSLEHPMPSTSSDNIPDRNELDQQKMVISTLETEIEKSILEQKQLEQQIENVKVSISTVLSSVHKSLFHEENSKPERAALSAGIQDRLNELQNHFAQANNTKANIEKLETRREDLASKLKQLSAKCKELQIDFQSTNETYSGKLAILEQTLEQLNLNGYEEKPSNWALALTIDNTELKRKLDKARNFLQILLAAHENAQNEYMEAEKLYSSIEGKCQSLCNHLNEYKNNLDSSAEILNKQLTELGFKSQEDLSTKIRKPDDIENEELIIKEFQSKFQSAKDRYTRAQNEAANLERQNLETLRENLDQTRKLIEDLAVSKGQLENQNSQITKTIEHIESIENKLLAFQDNYKTIGHLAQIANGKNSLGITFQRFVLTSLLDDILVSASQRLNMMSRGRYTLQRSLQRSDRRKSFGLDLEIFDAYTGNQRNVSTLSGGESFLAALSLALGLSDVVQAYSGGIKLDTIFIDEGFGSLDPESLDLAMRALMDLQKEGRLVGIISHVPELKERIDTRLEIVAGSNGSKTKLFS